MSNCEWLTVYWRWRRASLLRARKKTKKPSLPPDNVARNVFEISHQNSYLGRKFLIVNEFFFASPRAYLATESRAKPWNIFKKYPVLSVLCLLCVLLCSLYGSGRRHVCADWNSREKLLMQLKLTFHHPSVCRVRDRISKNRESEIAKRNKWVKKRSSVFLRRKVLDCVIWDIFSSILQWALAFACFTEPAWDYGLKNTLSTELSSVAWITLHAALNERLMGDSKKERERVIWEIKFVSSV